MQVKKLLNKSLKIVNRSGHWINQRAGYLTMERNERVSEFSNLIVNKIQSLFKSYDFRTYPDNIDQIYSILAKWLKIKKNQIILTDGADGALLRIFETFSNPGDKVIFYNPSYAMYPVYCEIFKCKPLLFHLNPKESQMNTKKRLFAEIKTKKPKIIALANPNQPIETMLSKREIFNLCKLAEKTKSIVVIDEAYYHFNNITALQLINKINNLIVVRTFSKAFGLAGLRIGYAVSNSEVINFLKVLKPIYEINNINLKICKFFIENVSIMKKYTKEVSKSRKLFFIEMKKKKLEIYGKYSNTVLLKLKNVHELENTFEHLYKNKILVKKSNFNKQFYLRCTLGDVNSTKILIRKIKEVI
jgi:histidinol-phosphate aminotransferase